MERIERDIWRGIARSAFLYGDWRSAWRNLRFVVGMRVGGFKSASR